MILFKDEKNKREVLINPAHIVCAIREDNETTVHLSENANIKSMGISMGILELAYQMNEWYAAIHGNKPS